MKTGISNQGLARRARITKAAGRIRAAQPVPIHLSEVNVRTQASAVAGVYGRVLAMPATAERAGTCTTIRRLDTGGRFAWEPVRDVLGWDERTVLAVQYRHLQAVLTATADLGDPQRDRPVVDGRGRVRIPKGLRVRLGVDGASGVVARIDPDAATLTIGGLAAVGLALEMLDRAEYPTEAATLMVANN